MSMQNKSLFSLPRRLTVAVTGRVVRDFHNWASGVSGWLAGPHSSSVSPGIPVLSSVETLIVRGCDTHTPTEERPGAHMGGSVQELHSHDREPGLQCLDLHTVT